VKGSTFSYNFFGRKSGPEINGISDIIIFD
jgi:hypothetical protein